MLLLVLLLLVLLLDGVEDGSEFIILLLLIFCILLVLERGPRSGDDKDDEGISLLAFLTPCRWRRFLPSWVALDTIFDRGCGDCCCGCD